jgi:hypothetical protein
MLVFVVIPFLGRLAVLLVVAAPGPAALMCHAIPFAELVARAWWKSLLSCLLGYSPCAATMKTE